MDEVQLSQDYSATMRRRLLFTTKAPGVSGIYFINLGRVMEPFSGFEPGTPGLGSERLNTRPLLQIQIQRF